MVSRWEKLVSDFGFTVQYECKLITLWNFPEPIF